MIELRDQHYICVALWGLSSTGRITQAEAVSLSGWICKQLHQQSDANLPSRYVRTYGRWLLKRATPGQYPTVEDQVSGRLAWLAAMIAQLEEWAKE